ncbi:MAG: MBL fold metallo-hydrolase [Planctomycetes bacterium]|nr:MBL fold metallo-hydrolase [Planctomycetota bacterium]
MCVSSLKITFLIENTTRKPSLHTEHGLSMFIEADDTRVLFDTGSGSAFIENSEMLGFDLSSIDHVVLSHGHYDHAGGLSALLEKTGAFRLYAHPEAFTPKFSKRDGVMEKAGFDVSREELEAKTDGVVLGSSPLAINSDISTTGAVRRYTDFEDTESHFFKEVDGQMVRDHIDDDLSLVIDTAKGLVVVTGCAHSGTVNILDHVADNFGGRNIYALVGGLHLCKAPYSRIAKTIYAVRKHDIQRICLAHCTGERAVQRFTQAFGEKAFPASTGMVLEF